MLCLSQFLPPSNSPWPRADEAGPEAGQPGHAGQPPGGGPHCGSQRQHLAGGGHWGHGPGCQHGQVTNSYSLSPMSSS